MTTSDSLTHEQRSFTNRIDSFVKKTLAVKEQCANYKIGDVYVMTMNGSNKEVEKNSLGEALKFKVVYISSEGIPFYQQLSARGVPAGELSPVPEALFLMNVNTPYDTYWSFVPDPDQLDAIMLQQEYDPMKQHREKLILKVEIDKFNKKIIVPTSWGQEKIYYSFFKGLQVGDKFWTSPEKQYVVHKRAAKMHGTWSITVVDNDQKELQFDLSHFEHKRVYKERPRSFTQESKK